MRYLFLLLGLSLFLSSCSSMEKLLENRVGCSLDRKQGMFISWYGPIGVGAKIADGDSSSMCAVPVSKPASGV